jgi:hypothetical protein
MLGIHYDYIAGELGTPISQSRSPLTLILLSSNLSLEIRTMFQTQYTLYVYIHHVYTTLYLVSDLRAAIMATPYTGLSIAASCDSRSSHGQVHPFTK